ncbi:unnamed protein product [Amaranthus hypochondriacus]
MSLAAQCIQSKYIEGLYYLTPGLSLKDGLRKVVGDAANFHLRKAAVESPLVNVYVVQTLPTSCLSLVLAKPRDKQKDSFFQKSPSTSRPPKLPFVSGSSQAVSPCLGVSYSSRPRTLGLQRCLHASAQPSKTGRNGRAIYSGLGSRGGRVGRSASSRERSINISENLSSQVTQE